APGLSTPRLGGITASYALLGISLSVGRSAGGRIMMIAPFSLLFCFSCSDGVLALRNTTLPLTGPSVALLQPTERIANVLANGAVICATSFPRVQACGISVVSRCASPPSFLKRGNVHF